MPIYYLSLNGRCQFIHNVNLEQCEQCAVIELWFEYFGAIEICLEGEKWVTGIILCWNWLLRARWSVLWSINKSLGTNLSYHDMYISATYTYTWYNIYLYAYLDPSEHSTIGKKRIKLFSILDVSHLRWPFTCAVHYHFKPKTDHKLFIYVLYCWQQCLPKHLWT